MSPGLGNILGATQALVDWAEVTMRLAERSTTLTQTKVSILDEQLLMPLMTQYGRMDSTSCY